MAHPASVRAETSVSDNALFLGTDGAPEATPQEMFDRTS